MDLENADRMGQIRAKVREERELLSYLEQKVADDGVKKALLGPALLRLDQVEGFYLDQKRLAGC